MIKITIDLIAEAKRLLTLAQDRGDMPLANVLTRALRGETVCLAAVFALLAADRAVEVALAAEAEDGVPDGWTP